MSEIAVKNHDIVTLFQNTRDILAHDKFTELTVEGNESATWNVDKIRQVVSALSTGLSNSPSLLISLHGLNQMKQPLVVVLNELTAYVGNGNVQHIQNAANQIDGNVLPLTWAIPLSSSSTRVTDAYGTGEQFRATVAELIRKIGESKSELSNALGVLTDRANTSANQLSELQATADREKQSALATVSELKSAYAALETELRKSFETQSARAQDEFSMDLKTQTDDFSNMQKEHEASGRRLIDDLEAKQREAGKIVQIVGNIGVTGNYQKLATDERKAASLWRFFTLCFFSVSVGVIAWGIISFTGGADWHLAVIRVLAAIGLTAPAYYTARESARHRSTADAASRAELELASLGPFIQSLPEVEQAQIRKDLISRYFGQASKEHTVKESFSVKDIKAIAEIVKAPTP